MKISNISISSIKVEDRSREEMGDIQTLKDSIEEKGLIQPITVNADMKLLAGGRRLEAVKQLGWETIPAVIRNTTKAERELDDLEIELFENIHRKDLTWQEKINLTARIHSLMQAKFGDEWSQRKTAALLGKSVGSINDAVQISQAMEVIPELAAQPTADKARRKLKRLVEDITIQQALEDVKGEVDKNIKWASSHYRIGDVLTELSPENMAEGVANFAEVDPPYAIDLEDKVINRERGRMEIEDYNEIPTDEYVSFINKCTKLVYRALSKDAFCIWWFGPTWFTEVKAALKDAGFHVDDIPGIWVKDRAALSSNPETYLSRGYEPFFICRKGRPPIRKRGRSNVFNFSSVPTSARVHPTERPVELMAELLRTFAYPQAVVLVPFLGSGNTLIAAYSEGMTGWGYDLSENYKKRFLAKVSEMRRDGNEGSTD